MSENKAVLSKPSELKVETRPKPTPMFVKYVDGKPVYKTKLLSRKPGESDDEFFTRMTNIGYGKRDDLAGHWVQDGSTYHVGSLGDCSMCKNRKGIHNYPKITSKSTSNGSLLTVTKTSSLVQLKDGTYNVKVWLKGLPLGLKDIKASDLKVIYGNASRKTTPGTVGKKENVKPVTQPSSPSKPTATPQIVKPTPEGPQDKLDVAIASSKPTESGKDGSAKIKTPD